MLDAELTPRYLGWSVLVLGLSLYFFIRSKQIPTDAQTIFSSGLFLSFAAYFLISAISLRQAINFSEGIYELSKIGLQFLFFIMLFLFLQRSQNHLLLLLKFIHIGILMFAVYGFFQIYLIFTSTHITLIRTYIPYTINDVSSTLSNKNLYSEILLLFLPFALAGIRFFNSKWKLISYINLGIIISHIIMLQSITVWIAVVISLL